MLKNLYKYVLEPTLVAIYLAMIAIMFVSIFFRYVLGLAITWSEEASLYIYEWLVFIAAAIGISKGTHVRLDAIIRLLPKKITVIICVFGEILQLILYSFIVIQGIKFILLGARQIGTSLPINRAVVYAIIPFCFFLSCISTIVKIVIMIKEGKYE